MDNGSLGTLLTRLRRLQQAGALPVSSEDGAADSYEVMLFPPAGSSQIEAVQTSLRKQLPDDFIRFWRFTNGANLFLNDSGLHGVGVASTDLMAELQEEEAEFYGPTRLQRYAVFARVNGAGDFMVFDLETGRVLDGIHAEQPHEWRPIAASFTHWLELLVDAGGRYYWLEALYDSARGGSHA